jgi:hypothetical protein
VASAQRASALPTDTDGGRSCHRERRVLPGPDRAAFGQITSRVRK